MLYQRIQQSSNWKKKKIIKIEKIWKNCYFDNYILINYIHLPEKANKKSLIVVLLFRTWERYVKSYRWKRRILLWNCSKLTKSTTTLFATFSVLLHVNKISATLTHFSPNIPFLYLLKTSENQDFSDVFRAYGNELFG